MAEKKKIVRLADVGELENILKKDLAEEEAKGKDADTLFCEDVAGELTDLESLPTIDPDDLRGHAKWEKPKELFFIMIDGDGPDDMHEEPAIRCSNCGGMVPQSDFDKWVWNFCPVCGCKMEDATNEQTEMS